MTPEDTVSLREYLESLVKVQEKALDAHKLEAQQERAEVKAELKEMNGKLDTVLTQQTESKGAFALKDKLWIAFPAVITCLATVVYTILHFYH